MQALYIESAKPRGRSVARNTAESDSYIRHPVPSAREQMALICSDRDRLASRKKKRGA